MKYYSKLFIIYFPIVLVLLQVVANVLSLVNKPFYYSIGFYLNTFLGTNILFSVFMLLFTYYFKFCTISRAAAIAEVLFGLAYLIIQEDNIYNISFQIIVGITALLITARFYMRKFPDCTFSMVKDFIKKFFLTLNCNKALAMWENDKRQSIINSNGVNTKNR